MKILRNNRLDALWTKNIRQYFFYGLGEVALIVFGILLALQINTWNEDRASEKKLRTYYDRLLADIQSNVADYNFLVRLNQERLDSIPFFLQLLYQQKSLAEARKLMEMDLFPPRNKSWTHNTYEDLKSTGNLSLIPAVALKDQLNNYYDDLESRQETINLLNAKLGEPPRFSALREKLLTYYGSIYEKHPKYNLDWQWLNQPTDVRFQELEDRLLIIADIRRLEIRLLTSLKAKAEKTIQSIRAPAVQVEK